MGIDDCLQGNVIKHEATLDLEKLGEFRKKHDEHLQKKCLDPAGWDYNFKYIPSSCGTGVHIECGACGEKQDITDYSNW